MLGTRSLGSNPVVDTALFCDRLGASRLKQGLAAQVSNVKLER